MEAPPRRPSAKDLAVSWGRDAAHVAYISLRTAYRLEVHAGYWLPYDGTGGSQVRSQPESQSDSQSGSQPA